MARRRRSRWSVPPSQEGYLGIETCAFPHSTRARLISNRARHGLGDRQRQSVPPCARECRDVTIHFEEGDPNHEEIGHSRRPCADNGCQCIRRRARRDRPAISAARLRSGADEQQPDPYFSLRRLGARPARKSGRFFHISSTARRSLRISRPSTLISTPASHFSAAVGRADAEHLDHLSRVPSEIGRMTRATDPAVIKRLLETSAS